MEQVFTTNWVFRQSSATVQMACETSRRQAQALVYSLGNLILLLVGPRYWTPSVYLIQNSVSSTETPGKSFLPLRRKRNGARKAGQGGARSLLLHGHSASTTFSVRFRDTAASETQQRKEFNSFFSNLAHSRTPCNKGRGLSISFFLTIAVLKFQLWNLFCTIAWNRNIGAVPKFAQR